MSPKTKKQNEAIRQQSIEAIKQAALSLFSRKGYGNTSISAIAKEANVSKGLMYNYFESKQALLMAIISDAAHVSEDLMGVILNEEVAPKVRLLNLINGTFAWVKVHLQYYKLLASLAFQEEAAEAMGDFVKMKAEGHIKLGEQLFQQMGYENPRIASFEFGALLDGIFITYMSLGDYYPLEEMRQVLLKKYDLLD
ncbi:MAG: AcrR family transcriptional regulator [Saprospiraceae bacterium]